MLDSLEILVALIVIVVAAEVFTNAVEHLGERLKIAEGATGSLFAAAPSGSRIPCLTACCRPPAS